MRVVVVSPHRDDAAFSLGLTIEHWLQAGHRVHVLNCFTQSEYAPYSDADSLHANDRRSFVSALRRREDEAWNKLLWRQLTITDLDLLDAPLRLGCSLDEVLQVDIRPGDRALARVAGALRKLAVKGDGSGLAILLPLAVGGHIDHRITKQAGLEALAEPTIAVGFYEDLPYAARPGGAEEISGLADALSAFGQRAGFAEQTGADVAQRIARKQRFAECYDSQIDQAVAKQIAAFGERYDGRERFWVNSAWPATLLMPSEAAVSPVRDEAFA